MSTPDRWVQIGTITVLCDLLRRVLGVHWWQHRRWKFTKPVDGTAFSPAPCRAFPTRKEKKKKRPMLDSELPAGSMAGGGSHPHT